MSKFQPHSEYQSAKRGDYALLPLRFTSLNERQFVLTNFAGEYHVLDKKIAREFMEHRLDEASPHYEDLKSKHFLLNDESSVAIDLLALKTRTRMERITQLTGLHLFVVTLRCRPGSRLAPTT